MNNLRAETIAGSFSTLTLTSTSLIKQYDSKTVIQVVKMPFYIVQVAIFLDNCAAYCYVMNYYLRIIQIINLNITTLYVDL